MRPPELIMPFVVVPICQLLFSEAMLQEVFERSPICRSSPRLIAFEVVDTFALLPIVIPFAFIAIPLPVLPPALPLLQPLFPHASVLLSVPPYKLPDSMSLPVSKRPLVYPFCTFLSTSDLESLLKLSLKESSIREENTEAIWHFISDLPKVYSID